MSKVLQHKLSIACALALTLSLTACDNNSQQQAQQQQALPVDFFTITTLDVPVVSHLTGRANATRKAEVRPQVNGVIQQRLFTEGATIEQGQQLYQIDPSIYEADLASAQANLASAKANEHSTSLKATRYQSLLNQKAVSKQDYDDAEAAYLAARASVQAAQAQVRQAEINLAYTKVYAPISGVIGRSDATEGALVSAQQATALATIQQLDPIYLDLGITVEEHLLLRQSFYEGKLKTHDGKASVDIFFNDGQQYPEQGSVEFADVTVNESTGMVNLRVLVPNPHNVLLPGMFLRGDINQGIAPDALVVDVSAVQREPTGTTYVYLIDENNIVTRRDIQIGTQYQRYYVVLDGLQKGEKVIVSNTQKVRIGIPVTPIEAKVQVEAQ